MWEYDTWCPTVCRIEREKWMHAYDIVKTHLLSFSLHPIDHLFIRPHLNYFAGNKNKWQSILINHVAWQTHHIITTQRKINQPFLLIHLLTFFIYYWYYQLLQMSAYYSNRFSVPYISVPCMMCACWIFIPVKNGLAPQRAAIARYHTQLYTTWERWLLVLLQSVHRGRFFDNTQRVL